MCALFSPEILQAGAVKGLVSYDQDLGRVSQPVGRLMCNSITKS